jgi:RNA-directed DNA polymerase
MLGIPTVLDRFIQQALLQVLSPIFDPTFSDASFGFRPGRSTHQAVQRARGYIAAGHRWVVDVDLEKFFDRVNHDVLMARVARRVKDTRVLLLIRRYLQAGMMEGGLVSSPRTEGTPQGGPLSPLLSNILLDEWDRELERRGHRFVRYADDCNVYVRSKAAGERVLTSLERWLTQRLRLRVNRDKSGVARPWTRKFLGYSVTWDRAARLRVSPAAVTRLKTKLRGLLRQGRGRCLADAVADLNLATRGWVVYFRLAEVTASFEDLDKWLRRKLRCVVWRQWKRPRTRLHELRRRGLDEARARASAFNGRGPWWNAGASHMHAAVPTAVFRQLGLLSLLAEHQSAVVPGRANIDPRTSASHGGQAKRSIHIRRRTLRKSSDAWWRPWMPVPSALKASSSPSVPANAWPTSLKNGRRTTPKSTALPRTRSTQCLPSSKRDLACIRSRSSPVRRSRLSAG